MTGLDRLAWLLFELTLPRSAALMCTTVWRYDMKPTRRRAKFRKRVVQRALSNEWACTLSGERVDP